MELKQKFRNGLKALREGAVSVVRRHPVELVLLLALTVTMLVYLEREDTPASWVTLLGWSALVQLIVNLLVGQGPWRRIYWVVWLPFVPLALWPGLPRMLHTDSSRRFSGRRSSSSASRPIRTHGSPASPCGSRY